MIVAAALVVLAVGQIGRVPVPVRYQRYEQALSTDMARSARSDARRADVLLIGDSQILWGVDPQELARNLRLPGCDGVRPVVACPAAPALTPASSLWVWRKVSGGPHRPRARLAVVGVGPAAFLINGYGNDFACRYLYGVSDTLWLVRGGRIDDAAALLTYRVFPLYARRGAVLDMVFRRPSNQPVVAPDEYWIAGHQQQYANYRVDQWHLRCLEHLVAEMQAHGVRVILVSVPVDIRLLGVEAGVDPRVSTFGPAVRFGKPGSPLFLFSMAIKELSAGAGVPYLNYRQARYSTQFSYWNPAHLLPSSAPKFTRVLAHDLNATLSAHGASTGTRARRGRGLTATTRQTPASSPVGTRVMRPGPE